MTRPPFLLIDAGNSRIKWALTTVDGTMLETGVFGHAGTAQAQSDQPLPAEPAWQSSSLRPSGAWISNVAGAAAGERLDALIDAAWPGLPRTTIRASAHQCGVTNGYREPARLGSDRWAAMIGARAAFPGEDLLIATLGTATTLEALRADGMFTGGLIAPGWSLMMRSLGEHTAQLPILAADSVQEPSRSSTAHAREWFATDTPQAISAGSLLAQTALVERAWHELARAWNAPVRLVLGGGAADTIARALNVPCTRRDSLVLSGLALIAAEGSA